MQVELFSSQGKCWVWDSDRFQQPEPRKGSRGMRTHGVSVLPDGRVIIFRQGCPGVLIYSPCGELIDQWGDYPGAHGLTLTERHGEPCLWLTDEFLASVELRSLDGKLLHQLERPNIAPYSKRTFAPTWVAEISGERVWLADGYGAELVHAYDAQGRYLHTIGGSAGAGRFSCPHGIAVQYDPQSGPRLLVADRGNARIQEFGVEGNFLGSWGEGVLHSPNGFAFHDGTICITELYGRVTLVNASKTQFEFLGNQPNARHLPGWPDVLPELRVPGLFNSPHAAAWTPEGDILVVEWIKRGRITKLSSKLKCRPFILGLQ